MSMANTSQHLQRLKRAGLVEHERLGTSLRYRIASPVVARLWIELRSVAEEQLGEMDRAIGVYRPQRHEFAQIGADELMRYLANGEVVVLDVRPRIEYEASHLPGAISMPLDELPTRLDELPSERLIVAYCRGPLCVYADQALGLLAARGRKGVRLEEGTAEWRLLGYPLEQPAAAETVR
jgi:rhodanese-related sulfurtransferase